MWADEEKELIKTAIRRLELDFEIRDDYTGRGMYEDTCLAIITDNLSSALLLLGAALVELDDEGGWDVALKLGETVRLNSMGHGTVVYFPGIKE